jgi:hypothetical protein
MKNDGIVLTWSDNLMHDEFERGGGGGGRNLTTNIFSYRECS